MKIEESIIMYKEFDDRFKRLYYSKKFFDSYMEINLKGYYRIRLNSQEKRTAWLPFSYYVDPLVVYYNHYEYDECLYFKTEKNMILFKLKYNL